MDNLRVNFRIWIELDDEKQGETMKRKGRKRKETTRFICGYGVYKLLSAIKETGSLTMAAKKVGYSYKYAWERTKKIEERLGVPAVEAHKGGRGGGGTMVLSKEGDEILSLYREWLEFFNECSRKKDDIEKIEGFFEK
ncbi:MAG: winged helix-turn-helix domain-containing protein [Promethearchaeota archaeon]